MFKDYKYSVICKMYIASFFRFLLLSTSNVRMSEGTFCRVAVHILKIFFFFSMKFLFFTSEKQSLYIAWESFRIGYK